MICHHMRIVHAAWILLRLHTVAVNKDIFIIEAIRLTRLEEKDYIVGLQMINLSQLTVWHCAT